MILDEIYKAIKVMRKNNEACPFQKFDNDVFAILNPKRCHCDWCLLLFPEIANRGDFNPANNWCPCNRLGYKLVSKEMQRLFP